MVCPLRYIVAGVSIIVALLVLLYTSWSPESIVVVNEEMQVKRKKKSFVQATVDFFTGRYLLDLWKEHRPVIFVPEHVE